MYVIQDFIVASVHSRGVGLGNPEPPPPHLELLGVGGTQI